MVERRLELETEVQEIFHCIDNGDSFLLGGGAGSGKTYSLVQVIKQIIAEQPAVNIACMTYTNAAVKEIEERVNHNNLNVSTYHDFLWDCIKHFQKELKQALINLINDEVVTAITLAENLPIDQGFYSDLEKGIQYKEYIRVKEGIISHDQVLIVANYMFCKYPKLCDTIKDKYPFILIDEYQDTQKEVVQIFLEHLSKSTRKNIVGFFGDSMQSIYPDGIGNLDDYSDRLTTIPKKQNRRNPQRIIDLANTLRTDGITQEPSGDINAPNMDKKGRVKLGKLSFIYSKKNNLNEVRKVLGWDFTDSKETKELNLTHNLIAGKAKFRSLMDIYDKDYILKYKDKVKKYIKENNLTDDFSDKSFGQVIDSLGVTPSRGNMQTFIDEYPKLFQYARDYNYDDFSRIYVSKDQLLDDKKQNAEEEEKKGSKRDNLIKHLFKIQNAVFFYKTKRYNEFLRVTDYRPKLISIEEKRILKEGIESLIDVGDKTIEEIIIDANEKGICLIDDNLEKFKIENLYVYDRVKTVKFSEFQYLYQYLEGYTPFTTQHKTKGAEFDNVLVIMDNGGWNNYNFKVPFTNTTSSPSTVERTKKLFYVCCTRAKENLAIFYYQPTSDVVSGAKALFGEDNIIDLDA